MHATSESWARRADDVLPRGPQRTGQRGSAAGCGGLWLGPLMQRDTGARHTGWVGSVLRWTHHAAAAKEERRTVSGGGKAPIVAMTAPHAEHELRRSLGWWRVPSSHLHNQKKSDASWSSLPGTAPADPNSTTQLAESVCAAFSAMASAAPAAAATAKEEVDLLEVRSVQHAPRGPPLASRQSAARNPSLPLNTLTLLCDRSEPRMCVCCCAHVTRRTTSSRSSSNKSGSLPPRTPRTRRCGRTVGRTTRRTTSSRLRCVRNSLRLRAQLRLRTRSCIPHLRCSNKRVLRRSFGRWVSPASAYACCR